MTATRLKRLMLINFRSYHSLTWDCRPELNIILGPNATGKTNLLEAVGYLGFARSLRQQQDRQLIAWGEKSFQVKGYCDNGTEALELAIIYQQNRKELIINNQQHRLVDLLGILPVIYFGPDDLSLIKGGPVHRRQFLDRELCLLDRFYCRCLQTYNHLLSQRNRLLRGLKAGQVTIGELEPWNIQLVAAGIVIIKARQAFLQQLALLAAAIYQEMDRQQQLTFTYQPGVTSEEEWLTRMERSQEQEIQAGLSLWGPHRDDFVCTIGKHTGRFFASQGQQRSAVLALKIAEARLMEELLGKKPILLLDDVFSELDNRRQQALLSLLAGDGQTFLTTTDLALLPPGLLSQATIWQISPDKGLQVAGIRK